MCLPLKTQQNIIFKQLSDSRIYLGKVCVLFLLFISSACDELPPDIIETEMFTPLAVTETSTEPVRETPTQTTPTISPTAEAEFTATSTPSLQPSPTTTPEATPTLPAFNVTGRICFPGSSIPPMVAYFEDAETSVLVELPIAAGQTTYEVSLEPGTYIAYAWLEDFSRGGLYSRAVPCGMGETCDDHGILPFTVTTTEGLTDIDICDWYAGPFNVPYPVGKSPGEVTGNISGSLTYVTDTPPGLRVVAFNLGTSYWYWVSTMPEQTTFIIPELPSGRYHVVAYDAEGRAGGYADANNNLIEVVVKAGETTGGVHITNWNAPPEAFPSDPTRQ
jgi:hypothetical protein